MKHHRGNHRVEVFRIPCAEGRPRPFCQAFTLIEMVVILGIIAVLSIILLPALSAASEESKRTACKSNLQAFGSAFGLFAADNDGWLPQHVGGKKNETAETQGWYGHTIRRGGELRNHGHLLPYLGTSSVFWCPSQTGDLTPPGTGQQSLARILNEQFLTNSENDKVQSQSEYLYRKQWYDDEPVPRYERYRMSMFLSENFTILADHFGFGEFGGVFAVTEGHENGYNFLRVDGTIDYFKHPRDHNGELLTSFTHQLGRSSELEWLAFDAYAGDTEKALEAMTPVNP
jgi:type II secretory pathway pseudopilin PulG